MQGDAIQWFKPLRKNFCKKNCELSYEEATALRREIGDGLFEDHNAFREQVDYWLDRLSVKLGAADKKILLRAVS
jgi:hypothetical protein